MSDTRTGPSGRAGGSKGGGARGSAGSASPRSAGRQPGKTGRQTARLDPDELAGLEEQRDFLLRSLADLEREHAAGDLEEDDYETLRDDYTARAAEVLRAIDDQRAAFEAAKGGRSLGRTVAVLAGVVVFAALSGWLVARSLGARQAGDTLTGGIDVEQSPSQRAQQCIQKLNPTAPSEAIECFQAVLDDDPRNPVALTWLGWQLGLSASFVPPEEGGADLEESARQLVERAVEVNPSYSYARAFRAVLAFRRGDYVDAKRFLQEFEDNDPSPDARQVIEAEDLENRIEEALAAQGTTTATTAPADATDTTPSSGPPATTAPG